LFLALVMAGFILLAVRVWQQRTLGWLLHTNMLATFFLFYTVQFLDTERFVARYNVRLWQDVQGTCALDLPYLEWLGPPAFESIDVVARAGALNIASEAAGYLETQRTESLQKRDQTSWASWQLRETHFRKMLLASPAIQPDLRHL